MNYIEKVKEFHEKFNHPTNKVEDDIDVEIRKLRLKLIFEELEELAEAMDVKETFSELCANGMSKSKDGDKVDKVEELDALCDIQYVLSGAILALGHHNNFDNAFGDVHDSNMTKLCSSMDEVNETIDYYVDSRGMDKDDITHSQIGSEYIVNRKSDMKVLKNVNYKSVKLDKYV
jgi:predicted HAD superfamily Cof-like phosphohydrolase